MKNAPHLIYDISPLISQDTAVFPGDQAFSRSVAMGFEKGDHLALSSFQSTTHIGAHVDAPSHYHADGVSIEQRDLSFYYGPCQVVSVKLSRGARILPADISGVEIVAPRVLFRTGSFPDPTRWNGDFNSLSPELITELAGQGVVLVGIDTPSVDPADSKALESHQAIFRHDLANLEGIVLGDVPYGVYTLSAFPLRIQGSDASPVRAVLIAGGAQ